MDMTAWFNVNPFPLFRYIPARVVCSQRVRNPAGAMSVSYSTGDSLDTAVSFYRRQMPQYGWELKKESKIGTLCQKLCSLLATRKLRQINSIMRDFYGGATGLVFSNNQGNGCYMQLMDNPVNKGMFLINVVYEEKRVQQ